MTSYYRKFIRDFAKIPKPLTRGEFARVKANQSRKIAVELDEVALQAFADLKSILSSSEVLAFPDFTKPFHLTTDASNYALGALLSQDDQEKDRPIAYISRSLNRTEENYATNEKEMLAIVWALESLRLYLYGAGCVRVYTDHQPLTFALGNRNFNAKLKRWKSRIEEYNCKLIYKPGKSKVVADALSQITTHVNYFGPDAATVHSALEAATQPIPHVEDPINVYRNQLIFDPNLAECLRISAHGTCSA